MPLTEVPWDDDRLMDLVGNRRFVLLGEASHGSHEFYQARARITRRLIEEKGFGAVAVEADWPDASRVNRYVQGIRRPRSHTALADFKRFPGWMWRNVDMVDFVVAPLPQRCPGGRRDRVGFYGLDLYSLQRPWMPWSPISRVDAEAAGGPRSDTLLRPRQGEGPEYGHAVTLDLWCRARTRWWPSWSIYVVGPTRTGAGRVRPRTNCSSPSRTPVWSTTRSSTTGRCTGAGWNRGTCGTATWPARCRTALHLDRRSIGSGQGGRLGAQLPCR